MLSLLVSPEVRHLDYMIAEVPFQLHYSILISFCTVVLFQELVVVSRIVS